MKNSFYLEKGLWEYSRQISILSSNIIDKVEETHKDNQTNLFLKRKKSNCDICLDPAPYLINHFIACGPTLQKISLKSIENYWNYCINIRKSIKINEKEEISQLEKNISGSIPTFMP